MTERLPAFIQESCLPVPPKLMLWTSINEYGAACLNIQQEKVEWIILCLRD